MNAMQKYVYPGLLAAAMLLSGCKHEEKNHAPVAFNTSVTTQADTELKGQLMASDSDGDYLLFALDSQPEQGILTLYANGKFFYQPNPDSTGTDKFTFRVSDKEQVSAIATVNITINALQVVFSSYSRQAYARDLNAQPLPLNSRNLQQDVSELTAYDDLLE